MTLVEVLVAMLIFSVGVLALTRLQILSLQSTQSAYLRTQAMTLAHEMIDQMRANRDDANSGAYVSDFSRCGSAPAMGTSRAEIDKNQWLTQVAQRLPDGCGAIEKNSELVVVSVHWSEAGLTGRGSLEVKTEL